MPSIVGILPSQVAGGIVSAAAAAADAAPLRDAVWPVKTNDVDVPLDEVAVTLAV